MAKVIYLRKIGPVSVIRHHASPYGRSLPVRIGVLEGGKNLDSPGMYAWTGGGGVGESVAISIQCLPNSIGLAVHRVILISNKVRLWHL